MPQLKVVPTFLPNKGIVLNKPEEFLKNQFSTSDSRNMEFSNELLQSRLGLVKMDTTMLSGPIQLIDQFWKFDGTWSLLFCTTKDIYKYNFPVGTAASSGFDILTPLYQTGTITCNTGSTIVIGTGAGIAWTGANGIKAGGFLKLGTGQPSTTDTWYQILSVGTNNSVILTTNAPTATASGYTIRRCFQGTSTDFWTSRTFIDSTLGDTWIATNGVDTPIKLGTGQVTFLGTGSSGMTSAKYVEVYKDRVIFLWTVEGGANQPQRIRWSAVANCQSWTATDFQDFMDDGFWITGTGILASSHVVFRERDAYIGRYIGGDYTFQYDKSSSCVGVWSPTSLVLFEREAYHYGPDNKFHRWNMLSDEIISESIYPHMTEYNPNLEQYIFGWQVEAKNQIRWFAPYSDTSYNNEVVVYDYVENIMQIWEYEQAQACCSIGEYLNTEDLYMDDATWGEYYLDGQEGFFDSRVFLSGAPVIIYGGYDGYIRKADFGYEDDGTAFNRVFESVRLNYKLPDINKRLWKTQWWLNSEPTGDITIKLKKNDNNIFETETKTISLINTDKDIIKKNLTFNKEAQNFKFQVSATNHFALLGFLSFIFSKGKTIR